MLFPLIFIAIFNSCGGQNSGFGGIIPVAYSPQLGVKPADLSSQYLQGVRINVTEYDWPANPSVGPYRAAMGNFNPVFGLNTTENSVAYFITGNTPPQRTNTSSWLRIAPQLSSLAAFVLHDVTSEIAGKSSILIADIEHDCRSVATNVIEIFDWTVISPSSASPTDLAAQLLKIKANVDGLQLVIAICDSTSDSSTPDFATNTINALLHNGLYVGSSVFIYTATNKMTSLEKFKNAGAKLVVVMPYLFSTNVTPVNLTKRVLEQISKNYVTNNDNLVIDGLPVQFTAENFLRLIHKTEVMVQIEAKREMETYTVCFTADGFPCLIDALYTLIDLTQTLLTRVEYDTRTGNFTPKSKAVDRNSVKLLIYQDTTFYPAPATRQYSMMDKLVREIFDARFQYTYKWQNVLPVANEPIQLTVMTTIENTPENQPIMTAFPLPVNSTLVVPHSNEILFDGIVMIKSRTETKVLLFRIFESLSGFIWLCVMASLLGVSVIFFIIKFANDRQTRATGVVPSDQDVSVFSRFLTVIFQNASAVFLAKMIVKPKMTSIRVLYQSYWMASIFLVATYAASLAEQRFVARNTVIPFDSLAGLMTNTFGYRWMFIRNSSSAWQVQQSPDASLFQLWARAQKDWPAEMFVEDGKDAARRIFQDDHLILIASRLEAIQILSQECNLEKSGPAEYLFALGFLYSGDSSFLEAIDERLEELSNDDVFSQIESRVLGIGHCPVPSDQLNMQTVPFSLTELGGLFIILLVGLIIAFIVAGIESGIEHFPMYRQWKDNQVRYGETYPGEVLNIQDNGIWIRLLDRETTAFVDASRIKTMKGRRAERLLAKRETRQAQMSCHNRQSSPENTDSTLVSFSSSLDNRPCSSGDVVVKHDGRVHMELGSFVKATYLGNDPSTANPIYTVAEEKPFDPATSAAVPPNNQND